jgi:aerobic C4-dicarboxylate transport protein
MAIRDGLPSKKKGTDGAPKKKLGASAFLYVWVLVGALAGVVLGFVAPGVAAEMKPLATLFVNMIKMLIVPIIFCTIVLGIGSIRQAATVGKIGGLALIYFIALSLVALAIGLVVGNFIEPGKGLDAEALKTTPVPGAAEEAGSLMDFIMGVIPTSLFEPFASGTVLQGLFIALLVGFAIQAMGAKGEPILTGIGHMQKVVFRVLSMVMWVAPFGAFGGLASLIGATGWGGLASIGVLMAAFYITCIVFVFGVLGTILRLVAKINVFTYLKYLAKEFLLILATSSSESALPRVMAKLEHAGIDKSTVGITIPTGYSFNLDGTAIYLTMASLFIAEAIGDPLSIKDQILLLLFLMVASKGAAGVSGAGLATLAGGLQAGRPSLADGVGIVVGIDRFMSEARALTNFAGNAIATLVIATWTKTVDTAQLKATLSGESPFDEAQLIDD